MFSLAIGLVLAFVGGALAWSFAEYMLHRFWGHEARGRNDFSREHLRHHSEDGYFTPTKKKLTGVLPFAVVLTAGLGFWLGAVGVALVAGFFAAYTTYEVLHYRLHITAPRNGYGRWARRHHFGHHFNCPRKNHGVTSPIWDVVFGTHQRIDRVRVPRRRAPASMPWLVDELGDLCPEQARDFTLVGR